MEKKGAPVRSPWPTVRVLGVDVGGVLVDRSSARTDTSFFGGRPMETPEVPGAREAVARLSALFDHRLYVVSKAGPNVAALTREWLGLHGFLGASMIPAANLFFVRQRQDKGPICKKLGVTHFVDDRRDVLAALVTVTHRYLFLGGLGRHEAPPFLLERIMACRSWSETEEAIARSLRGD